MDRQLKLTGVVQQSRPQLQRTNSFNYNDNIKFKPNSFHQKYHKTEPSVQNIKQQLPRKFSKTKNQFSQEYMSLVNKLKINLSKQYFDQRQSMKIIKEKDHFYNDQNYIKTGNIVAKHIIEKRKDSFQYFPRQNIDKMSKRSETTIYKSPSRGRTTERIKSDGEVSEFKKKRTKLPPMTSHDKKDYSNNLQEIEEQIEQERTTKLRKGKIEKIKHKFSGTREQRQTKMNQIYTNLEYKAEQKQTVQINSNYQQLDQLCFHIQILIDIYQCFNNKQKLPQNQLIKMLKNYVLGNRKTDEEGNIFYDDISHLTDIYTRQGSRKQLRSMIFSQRILVVICIDLLANRKLDKYMPEINQILLSLLGIYIYFVYACKQMKTTLSNYSQKALTIFQHKIQQLNIHLKKQIISSSFFIHKKLFPILKNNLTLLEQIKVLINQFETRNVTINRCFYQLLKLYAIYLNNHESLLDSNYTLLRTFATCPSPYLTRSSTMKYTLLLDLDETLVHTTSSPNKIQIFLRPYVKQFLQIMSKHYELVIFTNSMPDYAEQIIAQLPCISHKLFRYHATRLKNRIVKDISRLGRPIQKIIIIDNQQQNFILQKANGIKISQWRGKNINDQQLNVLGLFLNKLALSQPQDVRNQLPAFKQFRKTYN